MSREEDKNELLVSDKGVVELEESDPREKNKDGLSEGEDNPRRKDKIENSIQLLENEIILKKFNQKKDSTFVIVLTNKRMIILKSLNVPSKNKYFNLSEINSFRQKRRFNGHYSIPIGLGVWFALNWLIDYLNYLITGNTHMETRASTQRIFFSFLPGLFIAINFLFKRAIYIDSRNEKMFLDLSGIPKGESKEIIDEVNKQIKEQLG